MGGGESKLGGQRQHRGGIGGSTLAGDDGEDDTIIVTQEETGTWSLIQSRSVDDEEITIFEHSPSGTGQAPSRASAATTTQGSASIKQLIENARTRFRCLRHPHLVKMEWEQTDGDVLSIVTEPLLPLRQVLRTMSESEVLQGLLEILTALCFLNNTTKLEHGNVVCDAVFVSKHTYKWKLASFEHCKSQQNANDGPGFLELLDELLVLITTPMPRVQQVLQALQRSSAHPATSDLLQTLQHLPAFSRDPLVSLLRDAAAFFSFDVGQRTDFLSHAAARLGQVPPLPAARRVALGEFAHVPLVSEPEIGSAIVAALHRTSAAAAVDGNDTGAGGGDQGAQAIGMRASLKLALRSQVPQVLTQQTSATITVLGNAFAAIAPLLPVARVRKCAALFQRGLKDTDDTVVAACLRGLAGAVEAIGGGIIASSRRRVFPPSMAPRSRTSTSTTRSTAVSTAASGVASPASTIPRPSVGLAPPAAAGASDDAVGGGGELQGTTPVGRTPRASVREAREGREGGSGGDNHTGETGLAVHEEGEGEGQAVFATKKDGAQAQTPPPKAVQGLGLKRTSSAEREARRQERRRKNQERRERLRRQREESRQRLRQQNQEAEEEDAGEEDEGGQETMQQWSDDGGWGDIAGTRQQHSTDHNNRQRQDTPQHGVEEAWEDFDSAQQTQANSQEEQRRSGGAERAEGAVVADHEEDGWSDASDWGTNDRNAHGNEVTATEQMKGGQREPDERARSPVATSLLALNNRGGVDGNGGNDGTADDGWDWQEDEDDGGDERGASKGGLLSGRLSLSNDPVGGEDEDEGDNDEENDDDDDGWGGGSWGSESEMNQPAPAAPLQAAQATASAESHTKPTTARTATTTAVVAASDTTTKAPGPQSRQQQLSPVSGKEKGGTPQKGRGMMLKRSKPRKPSKQQQEKGELEGDGGKREGLGRVVTNKDKAASTTQAKAKENAGTRLDAGEGQDGDGEAAKEVDLFADLGMDPDASPSAQRSAKAPTGQTIRQPPEREQQRSPQSKEDTAASRSSRLSSSSDVAKARVGAADVARMMADFETWDSDGTGDSRTSVRTEHLDTGDLEGEAGWESEELDL